MSSLFGSCCCSDQQDRTQLTFNHSTTDEGSEQVKIGSGSTTRPLAATTSPHTAPTPASLALPSPGTTDDGSTARSLTPEEKEAEKSRLQALVNTFAKRAVRGCQCQYLKEGNAERLTTQYRIDKSLEYLIVVNPSDPQTQEVTCPIASIQDIYSLVEDGESCFPPELVKNLSAEEKELLLMVVYRSGADKMFRFCLLEETRDSRDIFLECLRILCIYAQSTPSAS